MRTQLLNQFYKGATIRLFLKNGDQAICKLKKVMYHLLIVDSESSFRSILLLSEIKGFETIEF